MNNTVAIRITPEGNLVVSIPEWDQLTVEHVHVVVESEIKQFLDAIAVGLKGNRR